LALSEESFSEVSGHTLMAMITSAKKSEWPSDIMIDFATAGLRAPSKVRFKLFTLDNRLIVGRVGDLRQSDQRSVEHALKELLGFV